MKLAHLVHAGSKLRMDSGLLDVSGIHNPMTLRGSRLWIR